MIVPRQQVGRIRRTTLTRHGHGIHVTSWNVLGEMGELARTGLRMVRPIGTTSAVQPCSACAGQMITNLTGVVRDYKVLTTMSTERWEWKHILTVSVPCTMPQE